MRSFSHERSDEVEGVVRRAVRVHEADLVNWLQTLVRFDTSNPPGKEGEAQAWLAHQLRGLGLSVDMWDVSPDRPNVVGVWKGSGGGHSVILNGHVDVAEVRQADRWNHPPFGGIVEGRRLYGRGSSDMKCALAAFYFAVKGLKETGFQPRGDVILESVMGEEQNEPGTRACIERGYTAGFGIVGEDTGGTRVFANVGVISACVTLSAPYTLHMWNRVQFMHPGGQLEGANALEKMALRVIPALNELERHWANTYVHNLFPPGQQVISPFAIEGGGNPFLTPETCKLYFVVAYVPPRKKEDVLAEVEDHIRRTAEADLWLRNHPPTLEWKPSRFPLETLPSDIDIDHPAMQSLMIAHQRVWGLPLQIGGLGYASDVGFLFQAGIPSVCYGPGNPEMAHKVDEYVDLDATLNYSETISLFVRDWTG